MAEQVDKQIYDFFAELEMEDLIPALAQNAFVHFEYLRYFQDSEMDLCNFSLIQKKVFKYHQHRIGRMIDSANQSTQSTAAEGSTDVDPSLSPGQGQAPSQRVRSRHSSAPSPPQAANRAQVCKQRDRNGTTGPGNVAPVDVATLEAEKNFEGLVKVLYKPDRVLRCEAVEALTRLACTDNNRIPIARAGAIKALVHVLHTGDAAMKMMAPEAFYNLAYKNADIRKEMVDAGAVKRLVQVLNNSDSNIRYLAARAVKRIAYSSTACQIAVGDNGAIDQLVLLLQNRDIEGQIQATKALNNYAYNHVRNKTVIARSGALIPLVQILKSGTSVGKIQAARLFRSLADVADLHALISDAKAVAPLVQLVDTWSAEAQAQAAWALYHLSYTPAIRNEIKRAKGKELLENLSCKGNDEGKTAATLLLPRLQ
mmetsp:Transcript_43930/g.83898  ORF Transcript_43930/g.83898 Transcript_43930/m.83898 type:complete len:426 (+) Transcript_43930:115-1392(+)